MLLAAPLPDMMAIDGRNEVVQLADHYAIAPAAGKYDVQCIDPEHPNEEGHGHNDITKNDSLADDDDTASASAITSQLVQVAAPILAPPVQMQTQYLPAHRQGRGFDSLQSLQNRLPHPASNAAVCFAKVATDQVDDRTQRYHCNDFAYTI